ncbi:MAG TPA: hypothetical protein VLS93_14360 [Anaeromyxobacteraceae bacterium]|nr:hypothetical protein [Anaeromyxobacteraceae bacterium]
MTRPIYLLDRYGPKVGEATTDFLQADPYGVGEAPLCEACGGAIGMLHWEPPLRAEIETWGSTFGDLAFGPGDSFLVSERFQSSWRSAGLVGLQGFEPVEIVKVRHRGKRIKKARPRYFRVWPGRSEVAVDQVRSGIQWTSPPTCEVCRVGTMKGQERIVLEGEPEENVFIARGLPGQVLVDGRVRRFCEEHTITNCPLIPAERARYES